MADGGSALERAEQAGFPGFTEKQRRQAEEYLRQKREKKVDQTPVIDPRTLPPPGHGRDFPPPLRPRRP